MPEELLSVMTMNNQGQRIESQRKFATKPTWLNKNMQVKKIP